MITLHDALTANEFHANGCTFGPRGGITVRYRRNGQTKTWKTRPTHFSIPVKFGLYEYGYIRHTDANYYHTASDCPLNQTAREQHERSLLNRAMNP